MKNKNGEIEIEQEKKRKRMQQTASRLSFEIDELISDSEEQISEEKKLN